MMTTRYMPPWEGSDEALERSHSKMIEQKQF
jgi:hypothetical protein